MQITDLQNFIKERDYKPELKEKYFMKLVEEVGELSEVIRKDKIMILKILLRKNFMTCFIMYVL